MHFLKKIAALRARTVTALAAVSLVGVLALMSVMFTSTQGQAATPNEVLVTTEGTSIEMYTLQVSAQTVYETFKRNGLNAEGGKTLTVSVYDGGGTAEAFGLGVGPDGEYIPTASIRLAADTFLRY